MTVGEKIQFYRKKIGLSQEELGQKMLVSRQTVSLWEMDKTLPTVDNLLRLKDIFSISVDDILCESDPTEENAEVPKEIYTFKYEKEDLRIIFKKISLPLLKRAIIFTLALIVGFISLAALGENETVIGLLMGCFLIGVISHIKGYLAYKKAWKSKEESISEIVYLYEIFEEYFMLTISQNEEIRRTQKVYFDDIEKIQVIENYLSLQISGQLYVLKKDMLAPDSALLEYCNRVSDNVESKKPNNRLRLISILLFVLSIATIWFSLIFVAVLSSSNMAMTENMWVFFVFLPIPIASVVFGFYLKKKGCKYMKNVVVGFIMSSFLCIYGSFSFIFADLYSHSDEPILNAEQILNIDIPQHSRINTQDWTQGTQSLPRGYIYSISDIYFDDVSVEEFEKNISNDTKWISDIPNDMVGITSYFYDIQTSDYCIVYNKDTGEFNKLPEEDGEYVFINILYDTERNTMKLVEYKIEYSK